MTVSPIATTTATETKTKKNIADDFSSVLSLIKKRM
ncbi:hypothetical protein MP638_006053, partial [Amoeboaphelidium occidentale]